MTMPSFSHSSARIVHLDANAEGNVYILVTSPVMLRSRAEALHRFLELLAEYQKAPQVTRERLYLETMQDVLRNTGKVVLDVKEGSNLTYLPLDRMIQPSTREAEFKAPDSPRIALPPTDSRQGPAPSFGDRFDRSRRER